MQPPISLVLEQGAMLKTLGRIFVKSALPGQTPDENPEQFDRVQDTLPAPSEKLVRHYLEWCGADADRYRDTLPPHLFTQWALPLCSRQLEQTKYNLAGIINQGCDVKINGDLPRGEALQVACEMVGISEENNRARVHQRLFTGTASDPEALVVEFHTVFILGRGRRSGKKGGADEKPEMTVAGTWAADANDGLRFALLTGDFNPIHWITPIAKMSPFRAKVLHGFGMYVRSHEVLQKALGEDITEIGVRFVKPVRLPSEGLRVLFADESDEDGSRRLELQSNGETTHLVGHFRTGG